MTSNGVAVDVPADRLDELSRLTGVTAVTKDRQVHLQGNARDDSTTSSGYVVSSGASAVWPYAGGGAGVSVACNASSANPPGHGLERS